MKVAMSVALYLVIALALVFTVQAADKEVTLKGSITCAKCDLKLEKNCTTVIQVKEGGKEAVYYFDPDSHKKYHKDICKEGKDGTVTGTVAEKGGKKVVTVKKLEYKD